jgi:nicotinamide-nucleotide amidase
VTGISESQLDQTIAPFYVGRANLETTVLAHDGDLQVRFRAQCPTMDAAVALSEEMAEKSAAALAENVYSRNGDSLETVIGKRLIAAGQTLVAAESATGGGFAARITNVAGSSAYFLGGYVTYTKRMKTGLLGVSPELLAEFGAVSSQTAQAMAEGARRASGADWAISITGNAGPATDGAESPVGAFYLGVAGPDKTEVTHLAWPIGDRERVRAFAVQATLNLLNRRLRG